MPRGAMFWGADTTQLTAFGSDASGRASALEGRCGTLGALIGSVTWAGQDLTNSAPAGSRRPG